MVSIRLKWFQWRWIELESIKNRWRSTKPQTIFIVGDRKLVALPRQRWSVWLVRLRLGKKYRNRSWRVSVKANMTETEWSEAAYILAWLGVASRWKQLHLWLGCGCGSWGVVGIFIVVEFIEPGGAWLQAAQGTVIESLKTKLDYNTFFCFSLICAVNYIFKLHLLLLPPWTNMCKK